MFNSSTQKKHWTFSTDDPNLLTKIRLETYNKFVEKFSIVFQKEKSDTNFFLTFEQSENLVKKYEHEMGQFCKSFQPNLPRNVIGSAFHYYKRFFLVNSPMNYHPKDIYPTCVFLGCKVDEYNLSIDEFLMNFEETKRIQAMELILNNEYLVISSIKFHLIIHNPFRAVKGILLDVEMKDNIIKHPMETLWPIASDFLEKVFYTDIIFYYAPSQIAFASIVHASIKMKISIDNYVANHLVPSEQLANVTQAVKAIRHAVRHYKFSVTPAELAIIEEKLDKCRNQENNIEHTSYKPPMDVEDTIDDDSFG